MDEEDDRFCIHLINWDFTKSPMKSNFPNFASSIFTNHQNFYS